MLGALKNTNRSRSRSRSTSWNLCILSIFLFTAQVKALDCPGWFGENCESKCHCLGGDDKCNGDGDCEDGCDDEWMGRKCQYLKLAGYEVAGTTYSGDDTPECTAVRTKKGLSLSSSTAGDFKYTPGPINSIRFWTRTTAQSIENQLIVWINGRVINCAQPTITPVSDHVADMLCWRNNAPVKTLNITGNAWPAICKVGISGGRNLALKRMSGNDKSKDLPKDDDVKVDVDPVLDGDVSTCRNKQKFYLPFSGQTDIMRFHFIGPGKDQNIQIKIAAYQGKDKIYTDKSSSFKKTQMIVPGKLLRKVTLVEFELNNAEVCEIEVYGECTMNYLGTMCDVKAHPAKIWEVCTMQNGCPSVCDFGRTGKLCNEECKKGAYGQGCELTCSLGCNGTNCDPKSGVCHEGCTDGGEIPFCKKQIKAVKVEESDNTVMTFLIIVIAAFVAILLVAALLTLKNRSPSPAQKPEQGKQSVAQVESDDNVMKSEEVEAKSEVDGD